MRIGLHDSEGYKYPNLALMKLSAWHKQNGDEVEWFLPAQKYDRVYSSKVFTWTPGCTELPADTIKGGMGYGNCKKLPDVIEHTLPDYSLYQTTESYGFLTRGCPNKCPWCFVPEKEGDIKAHADIEEFLVYRDVVLLDNNVLACDHGIAQIEKIVKMGVKVDFNQGLDARLIDDAIARLLSKVKWLHPIRLACDSRSQIESVRKATEVLRWNNATPRRYFCYVLVEDIQDAIDRVRFLKGIDVDPFAQPYRDKEGTEPVQEQKDFARWVNHKAIYKTVTWQEYKDTQERKRNERKSN